MSKEFLPTRENFKFMYEISSVLEIGALKHKFWRIVVTGGMQIACETELACCLHCKVLIGSLIIVYTDGSINWLKSE